MREAIIVLVLCTAALACLGVLRWHCREPPDMAMPSVTRMQPSRDARPGLLALTLAILGCLAGCSAARPVWRNG